ncbi:MAG: hypothetical protein JOY64_09545 [Alphaproteobacteria bacterium]|nr:hypothetical protein [Alphaproteobacteria bacterium]MBV8407862.1 hypothetical protein [Alphaproteobacteria bacterium]
MLSKSLAVALCLAGLGNVAEAADAPNLVGTWKTTGEFAAARTGKTQPAFGETPPFNNPKRVSFVVEKQEGRGFSGYRLLPDGSKDACVGVLKRDGKQALMNCDYGKVTLDFTGDVVESCFVSNLPDTKIASCDVMRKTP